MGKGGLGQKRELKERGGIVGEASLDRRIERSIAIGIANTSKARTKSKARTIS
jgi:hypothetical protein